MSVTASTLVANTAERDPALDSVYAEHDAYLRYGIEPLRSPRMIGEAVTAIENHADDIGVVSDVSLVATKGRFTEEYLENRDVAVETQKLAESFFRPGEPYFIVAKHDMAKGEKFFPQSTKFMHVGVFGDPRAAEPVTKVERIEMGSQTELSLLLNDTLRQQSDERVVLANVPLPKRITDSDRWKNPAKDIWGSIPAYSPGFGDYLKASASGDWTPYTDANGFPMFRGHAMCKIVSLSELMDQAAPEVRTSALAILYRDYGPELLKTHEGLQSKVPERMKQLLRQQLVDYDRLLNSSEGKSSRGVIPRTIRLNQGKWQLDKPGTPETTVAFGEVPSTVLNIDSTFPTSSFQSFYMSMPCKRWMPFPPEASSYRYRVIGKQLDSVTMQFTDIEQARDFVAWLD